MTVHSQESINQELMILACITVTLNPLASFDYAQSSVNYRNLFG